jgi:hypothetical protein
VILLVYLLFVLMFVFLIWSKKRIDRGEPLFGWRRKQYLAETWMDEREGTRFHRQSTQQLLGIKDVKYGIIEKSRNEYAIILATDSVNYDLLSDSGKRATVAGYEQLYKVLSFPLQIIIQAVRQDSRREIQRFREQSTYFGPKVSAYTEGLVQYIRNITWEESRIIKRVYYVISYHYEPSQNAQIRSEDRLYRVIHELNTRAIQVRNMLKRAQIKSYVLGSLDAIEVVRRSMNRDRTLAALIDDVERKEMLSYFVTANQGDEEDALDEMELWFNTEKTEGKDEIA